MRMLRSDRRDTGVGVLAAGGLTAVPAVDPDPATGLADHVAPIPADVLAALDAQPTDPALPLGSLLLAAHATVLAALSGERDVVTGYVPAAADRPLPCPLSAEPGSWRELLARTRDAERSCWPTPASRSRSCVRELGLTGPRSETEFDPAGAGRAAPGHRAAGGARHDR